MEYMNVLLIGVFTALLVLIVLMIVLLIRTGSRHSSGPAGMSGYGGAMPRELREEMYRSRQETIGMVQSSVKNMGDMLSQAQRESMEMQSRRLSELHKQFARPYGYRAASGKHSHFHGAQGFHYDGGKQPAADGDAKYGG